MARANKDASLESCSFTLDMAKIQRLDTNIVNMSAESLGICGLRGWYKRFAKKTGKSIRGEHFGVLSSCV